MNKQNNIQGIFKSSILALMVFTMSFGIIACKKDKPSAEADLVMSINPDPGNATTPVVAMGSSHTFQVNISSKMPGKGVDVAVVYKKDADQSTIFTQSYSTTVTPLSVTITGIPFNEVGTVTVTATSKSKASNTVAKTFKLVRK